MTLSSQKYLELLRADGDALVSAARKGPDVRVPSCPDWDVADLLRHTGQVHRHKATIVREGETSRSRWPDREMGPDDVNELPGWYEDGLDDLIRLLSSIDLGRPAPTWGTGTTAKWWLRRMAHETAVHRWDAENAIGEPRPIDAELASDGIDEFLGEFIPGEEIPWDGAAGTIHLHCIDVEGEWTVTLEPGKVPTYETGHSKGDAALRGSAEELLLVLWRRIEPARVEVLGDEELVGSFWAYLEGPGQ